MVNGCSKGIIADCQVVCPAVLFPMMLPNTHLSLAKENSIKRLDSLKLTRFILTKDIASGVMIILRIINVDQLLILQMNQTVSMVITRYQDLIVALQTITGVKTQIFADLVLSQILTGEVRGSVCRETTNGWHIFKCPVLINLEK